MRSYFLLCSGRQLSLKILTSFTLFGDQVTPVSSIKIIPRDVLAFSLKLDGHLS